MILVEICILDDFSTLLLKFANLHVPHTILTSTGLSQSRYVSWASRNSKPFSIYFNVFQERSNYDRNPIL